MKPGLYSRIAGSLKKGFASEYNRLITFADRRRIVIIAFGAQLGLLASSQGQHIFLIACIGACIALMILLMRNTGYSVLVPALIALILFGQLHQNANFRPCDLPTGQHSVNGTISESPLVQTENGKTIYTLNDLRIR